MSTKGISLSVVSDRKNDVSLPNGMYFIWWMDRRSVGRCLSKKPLILKTGGVNQGYFPFSSFRQKECFIAIWHVFYMVDGQKKCR